MINIQSEIDLINLKYQNKIKALYSKIYNILSDILLLKKQCQNEINQVYLSLNDELKKQHSK